MPLREPFNTFSHGVGILLAAAGLVFLVWQAETAFATAAYAVYGVSLVTLFLASTLYHALPVSKRARLALRRFDHTAIYLLIAGTYTPICLLAIPPGWGWTIAGIIWGLAAVGIVTRNLLRDLPRWAMTTIYLAMGWTAIVGIKPLLDTFTWPALLLLALGGIAYTVGAAVYAFRWPDPLPDHVGSHGIWHLFVLAGAGFHFAFIAAYVPPV